MNNLRERLRNESLRLYEDLEYTFNAHFIVAKKLGNLNLWLGIPSIILSVIAGCLALTRLVPVFRGICRHIGICRCNLYGASRLSETNR